MKHIGRMDILQASQYLIQEIADMIITQMLSLQQLIKVGLHQRLHYITIDLVKEADNNMNDYETSLNGKFLT